MGRGGAGKGKALFQKGLPLPRMLSFSPSFPTTEKGTNIFHIFALL